MRPSWTANENDAIWRLARPAAAPPEPQASVLPFAARLDRHEWDALVVDADFFQCRGWLAALDEALGPAEVLTVVGRTGLLGGCALWDGEHAPGLFYLPDFFRDVPGPWGRDFLWLGARRSTHNEIPAVRGGRRRVALGCVLSAAVRRAAERDRAGVVMPYMPLTRALEAASAHAGAHVLLHSAEVVQHVPPGGLSEMLASWRTHDRVRSKAELAAFTRFGNRADWTPLTPATVASAARLIAGNRAQYGNLQGEDWIRRTFDSQRRSGVIDAAVAVAANREDGRMAGICVSYRFGRSLHVRYFGSDYSLAENDCRYFVLCYYLPVDYAARHGLTRCRLSTSALEAKARRGGVVEPLAAVVIFTDSTTLDPDIVDRHNQRVVDSFRQQLPSRLGGDWSLIPH